MNFLFVYSVQGSHTIGSPSRYVTHYGMGHTIKHRYGIIVDLLVVSIKDFANTLIHVHVHTYTCITLQKYQIHVVHAYCRYGY